MPIDILNVDLDENLVVFRVHGRMIAHSLLDHRKEVTSQSWYYPEINGIYFFEKIESTMELIHGQELFRRSKPLVRKVALVLGTSDRETQLGVQMYAKLTQEDSSTIGLFKSIESAKEWIGLPAKK